MFDRKYSIWDNMIYANERQNTFFVLKVYLDRLEFVV